MDWKNSKIVGVIAAGALAVTLVFIIKYATRPSAGEYATFICASTGDTFRIKIDPDNQEYFDKYNVDEEVAAPCKICGKKDAYLAYKEPNGKWVKMKRALGDGHR